MDNNNNNNNNNINNNNTNNIKNSVQVSELLQYTTLHSMLLFRTATVNDTESTGLYCYSTRYCSTCFCSILLQYTILKVQVILLEYTILQYMFLYCYNIRHCSTGFCTATVHDIALHISLPYCYSKRY